MADNGFRVPEAQLARLAEPFDTAPATGNPNVVIDVSAVPGNDSGRTMPALGKL